jgi:hypothetical protein
MNVTTNTFKKMLILSMLPVAVGAQATCLTDGPEIGDIGPGSEVVCGQLEDRFAGADLAVEGRSIHSPTEVSVAASVDGKPVSLRYELSGFTWRLDETGERLTDVPVAQVGLPVPGQ